MEKGEEGRGRTGREVWQEQRGVKTQAMLKLATTQLTFITQSLFSPPLPPHPFCKPLLNSPFLHTPPPSHTPLLPPTHSPHSHTRRMLEYHYYNPSPFCIDDSCSEQGGPISPADPAHSGKPSLTVELCSSDKVQLRSADGNNQLRWIARAEVRIWREGDTNTQGGQQMIFGVVVTTQGA